MISQPVTPVKENFGPQPTFLQVQRVPTFPDRREVVKQQRLEARELEARRAALEAAKAQAALVQAQTVTTPQIASYAPVEPSDAKMFIYLKESGNNPSAVSPNGACGLGQALPCSKMPCSLSDYNCQDNYFTGYMQSRYGTWEAAKSFWLSHHYW